MNKTLSKRNMFGILILLALVSLGVYIESRPRLVPGQEPLTDIQDIETLRTQFNKDAGKTRLILLVSPT